MHILYLYYENIMNILLIFYNHNYKILYYISSMCIYSLLNNYIYIYIYNYCKNCFLYNNL